MRLTLPPLLALAAAAVATTGSEAAAQPPDDVSDAYCRYMTGVAQSESALRLSPELFANFGLFSLADREDDGDLLYLPTLRLTAGVRYSTSRVLEGVSLRAVAAAQCRRHAALGRLEAFLRSHAHGVSRDALLAKLAVLEEARPEAERLRTALHAEVQHGKRTFDELDALDLRVDALRAMEAEARKALAELPAEAPDEVSVEELLRGADTAEERLARSEARYRQAQLWDVRIRVGYDKIFGVEQRLPLQAIAQLSFNPGGLWQAAAENRARQARLRWAAGDPAGPQHEARELVRQMRALADIERSRLKEITVLLSDLRSQLAELEPLTGERVDRVRTYLWFDTVKLHAESAFLRAHLAHLSASLGQAPEHL